jgi:predicted phage-related endonuclease
MYRSSERHWQLATPDAVVFDARKGFAMDQHRVQKTKYGVPVIVQVKTASKRGEWGMEGTNEIPVHYKAQVMQEMDVVGAELAWVPVLFHGRDYKEYRVRRDDTDIEVLRMRGTEFWDRIVSKTPPPVDSSVHTWDALKSSFWVDDERVFVAEALMKKIARASLLEARLDSFKLKLENELRAQMGNAALAMVGDRIAAKRSTYTARTFDTKAFREEHPDLAEKFTKEATRQRMTVTWKEML